MCIWYINGGTQEKKTKKNEKLMAVHSNTGMVIGKR